MASSENRDTAKVEVRRQPLELPFMMNADVSFLQLQMLEAMRVLMDATDVGTGGLLGRMNGMVGPNGLRMRNEDPDAERFLQYFYDDCIRSLIMPITSLVDPGGGE